MAQRTEYVPGVCNIGPAETRLRMRAGWLGLGATVLLWALFVIFSVPAAWRLLLFLPASMASVGFLQAAMHFCAGFGFAGVFNLGPEAGKTDSVTQADFRKADRAKALRIALYSALIGLVVAIAGYLLVW
jgi:hypothetical protein